MEAQAKQLLPAQRAESRQISRVAGRVIPGAKRLLVEISHLPAEADGRCYVLNVCHVRTTRGSEDDLSEGQAAEHPSPGFCRGGLDGKLVSA
jgi:hypothetical protein